MTNCVPLKEQSVPNVWQILYQQYDNFKEERLSHRRFTSSELEVLIKELENDSRFTVTKAGESVEGRPIYLVKLGWGPKKVLLWSQMHGDEPTATAAIIDLFNFFQSDEDDVFDSLRQNILQNTTLYFLPMLNPDGAARYQRRNALDIDLNRDAQRLASPESQLLKNIRDSLQADWGFNLHDQNPRYAAGPKGPAATIALLAPPVDDAGTVDNVRRPAMQMVVKLNEVLQPFIPRGVAKWNDDFEPRAFGENMQRWGTSTILIESGGYPGDPEKQEIRKLNFVALLAAFQSIATGSWQQESIIDYDKIPENARFFYDLVVRNAQLEKDGFLYTADVGIDRNERELRQPELGQPELGQPELGQPELRQPNQPLFYYESSIEDLGDLSVFQGFEELNAKGLRLQAGKVYPFAFEDMQQLQLYGVEKLLKDGYTSVMLSNIPEDMEYSSLPINLQLPKTATGFGMDEPADFVLLKGDKVHYAIINGFVYNLQKGEGKVKNARVKR
ncbi:M14 family zinc carboxypeptidase [Cesiribacter sp. SM1]|uniref:M14 family zinc carboxypeptidase n=1 Tax=Cesiribacter sp. SM1 TaxID=2861196 RepID=UPI001CD3E411|nr:M14 family zinc carboxypeptidase [Cesiribacter sp. SM1]